MDKSLKRKHSGSSQEELATTKKRQEDEVVTIVDSSDSEEVQEVEPPAAEPRPKCKYGAECYRKNEDHLSKYNHSPEKAAKSTGPAKLPKKAAMTVLRAEDVNSQTIYLTKVHNIRDFMAVNQNQSLHLPEILAMDKEDFVQSAQFNYMHDLSWLIEQYPKENRSKPLTVVLGVGSHGELSEETKLYPNVDVVKAKLEMAYGTHHTKMMLLLYKTGMRVIVHTANMIPQDWYQKTQGMWISQLFPRVADASKANRNEYDSRTKFKSYLIMYLESYRDARLSEWVNLIRIHDTSSANVFLIGSVPGRFPAEKKLFGHLRMRKILGDYLVFDEEDGAETKAKGSPGISEHSKDKLVYQFSSIGTLGASENTWLCQELTNSMSAKRSASLLKQIKPICIYPSVENVRKSYEGYSAGGSLPYMKSVAAKQPYLKDFLYQWHAEKHLRTKAAPHIKTYARYSQTFDKCYWFLLTSANLSKAAWGSFEKNESQLLIRSYELGVLFLPSFIITDETRSFFDTTQDNSSPFEFLIPYDVPPLRYTSLDEPWIVDKSYLDDEDTHGRVWNV